MQSIRIQPQNLKRGKKREKADQINKNIPKNRVQRGNINKRKEEKIKERVTKIGEMNTMIHHQEVQAIKEEEVEVEISNTRKRIMESLRRIPMSICKKN